jgi:hypothetical protein
LAVPDRNVWLSELPFVKRHARPRAAENGLNGLNGWLEMIRFRLPPTGEAARLREDGTHSHEACPEDFKETYDLHHIRVEQLYMNCAKQGMRHVRRKRHSVNHGCDASGNEKPAEVNPGKKRRRMAGLSIPFTSSSVSNAVQGVTCGLAE